MGLHDIGGNIRRLMKLHGFSIPTLAERMEVGTATISNILNGKSEPKSSTLIKFADVLGVTFKDLLCDAPKMEHVRFRTSKTLSGREKAERDQILVSSAQWLYDYKELEALLGDTLEYHLADITGSDPVAAAKAARIRFGFSDPAEPVSDLAEKFEGAGIKLGISNFGFKKTFGLSVSADHNGPAIIVNSEPGISVERQIFTMVHELGHLLLHRASYDASAGIDDAGEEEAANIFAGQFLLPDEALRAQWLECQGMHWIDAVLKIKRLYKVSYKTVLYRLSQIDSRFVLGDLSVKFAVEYRQKTGHDLKNHFEPEAINDPVARFDPEALSTYEFIENRYNKLVSKALEKELITISRAGELLKKDALEMRALVRSWKDMYLHE